MGDSPCSALDTCFAQKLSCCFLTILKMANLKQNQSSQCYHNKQISIFKSISEKFRSKYVEYKDKTAMLKKKYKIKSGKLKEIELKYNILQSENEKKAKRITELEHKLQQLKQNVDDNNCMMQFMAIKMKEKELQSDEFEIENKSMIIKMKEKELQCEEFKKLIEMLFNRTFEELLDYLQNDFSKNMILNELDVSQQQLLKIILPQITEEHEKLKYKYLTARQLRKYMYFSSIRNGLVHHNKYCYNSLTFEEILNSWRDLQQSLKY